MIDSHFSEGQNKEKKLGQMTTRHVPLSSSLQANALMLAADNLEVS